MLTDHNRPIDILIHIIWYKYMLVDVDTWYSLRCLLFFAGSVRASPTRSPQEEEEDGCR